MDKGGKKAVSHPKLLCTCNCKLIGSGQEERGKGMVSHPETLCTDDIMAWGGGAGFEKGG